MHGSRLKIKYRSGTESRKKEKGNEKGACHGNAVTGVFLREKIKYKQKLNFYINFIDLFRFIYYNEKYQMIKNNMFSDREVYL